MPIKHIPEGSRLEVYGDRLGQFLDPEEAYLTVSTRRVRTIDDLKIFREEQVMATVKDLTRQIRTLQDKRMEYAMSSTYFPPEKQPMSQLKIRALGDRINQLQATLRNIIYCIHHVHRNIDKLLGAQHASKDSPNDRKIDKLTIGATTKYDEAYRNIDFCDVVVNEQHHPTEVHFDNIPLKGKDKSHWLQSATRKLNTEPAL